MCTNVKYSGKIISVEFW